MRVMAWYREPSCAIELVVGSCALTLVLGYRLSGTPHVGGAETGAWLALLWAFTQCARAVRQRSSTRSAPRK